MVVHPYHRVQHLRAAQTLNPERLAFALADAHHQRAPGVVPEQHIKERGRRQKRFKG